MRRLFAALILLASIPHPSVAQTDAEIALRYTEARELADEGSIPEALEAWRELLEMAPAEPWLRVEYARFLSRAGRVEEATEQAARALDLAPDNPDVLRGAADVHLSASRADAGHLETARTALERLVELRPDDVEALFDLGRVCYETGRWAAAAEWLSRAAESRPGDRALQSYRIDALLRAEQDGVAAAALEELLAADPSFLRARLQLAMLESDGGEHGRAAQILRAAPEEQKGDRQLRWQLAGQLYRTGELEEAIELLDSILASEPEAFRERMLKGMSLAALGRDAEAIAVYEDLHLDHSLNLDVVGELVELHERQGHPAQAKSLLRAVGRRLAEEEQAGARLERWRFQLMSLLWRSESWRELIQEAEPLVAEPESTLHPQAVFFLADALHGIGRSDRALEVLAAAAEGPVAAHRLEARRAEILAELDREDESERLLARLAGSSETAGLLAAAEVLQRRERYGEAASVLRRALEVGGESSQVLFRLGAAYERSGDRDSATTTFRQLLDLDPRHAPALNYLGYMWAEQGERLEEAVELVNRAVAQEPDNGAYVDSLGWALYQLGSYERARHLLERASRLVPDDATISEHLGDVYVALGEAARARESYRRALRLDGENREAVRRKLDSLPASH